MKSKVKKFSFCFLILLTLLVFYILFMNPATNTINRPNQLSTNVVMTVEQMEEDIDFLVEKIANNHPITYNTMPELLYEAIDSVKTSIVEPMTAGEFYFHATRITNVINDAHTSIVFYPSKGSNVINLPVKWLNEGLCIKSSTDLFNTGDNVISIGGKTNGQLLEELSKIISAENDGWVRYLSEKYITYDVFLRQLNIVNEDDTVTVIYERDNKIKEVNLPLMEYEYIANNNQNDWIKYEIHTEESIGYFRYDKCKVDRYFETNLKEFFKYVSDSGVENLVLDVRYNSGGNSYANSVIFSYIKDIDDYKPESYYARYSEDTPKQRNTSRTSGINEYKQDKTINKHQKDDSLLFEGDLYILTSNKTCSAATDCALIVQDNNLGKIVGEPTGNAPSCYSDVLRFNLPNSGYLFSVSHKKITRPEPTRDPANTLTPDVIVYTTAEDIKQGIDPQMEMVFNMIK